MNVVKNILQEVFKARSIGNFRVAMFTKLRMEKEGGIVHSYWADPLFSPDDPDEPWWYWALINWGEGCGLVPGCILAFVELEQEVASAISSTPPNPNRQCHCDCANVIGAGEYAIIYSAWEKLQGLETPYEGQSGLALKGHSRLIFNDDLQMAVGSKYRETDGTHGAHPLH